MHASCAFAAAGISDCGAYTPKQVGQLGPGMNSRYAEHTCSPTFSALPAWMWPGAAWAGLAAASMHRSTLPCTYHTLARRAGALHAVPSTGHIFVVATYVDY